jgi:hypothetical protein
MGFQMGKLLGQALLPVLLCVFFDSATRRVRSS